MLKCFKELKEKDIAQYKACVDAGVKHAGSESFFVMRSYGDLETLAFQIDSLGVGYDSRGVMARLTNSERVLVENLIRYTSPAKLEAFRASHKINSQRSARFVAWWLDHQDDLSELAELEKRCKRKAAPNLGETASISLDSLLN